MQHKHKVCAADVIVCAPVWTPPSALSRRGQSTGACAIALQFPSTRCTIHVFIQTDTVGRHADSSPTRTLRTPIPAHVPSRPCQLPSEHRRCHKMQTHTARTWTRHSWEAHKLIAYTHATHAHPSPRPLPSPARYFLNTDVAIECRRRHHARTRFS